MKALALLMSAVLMGTAMGAVMGAVMGAAMGEGQRSADTHHLSEMRSRSIQDFINT